MSLKKLFLNNIINNIINSLFGLKLRYLILNINVFSYCPSDDNNK